MAQETVDRLYSTLRIVDIMMRRLDIPYFAVAGTLLGAVRHGGLIPWDVDGDIGIRDDDLTRLLDGSGDLLGRAGYGLAQGKWWEPLRVFPLSGPKQWPWYRRRFPHVDIFPMRHQAPDRWNYAAEPLRQRYPGEFFEGADFGTVHEYRFGPLTLTAPPPAIATRYLTSGYGPKWRSHAVFDPYWVPAMRGAGPVELAEFPPALPSDRVRGEWNETEKGGAA
ncbi:LicD family protein [Nocardia sp. NPDC051570]|uniref:LicD family protein n=1 Tax=Nocardia sp. NPDC051570 TaxID=3364324 RepID=UPI00379B0D10